MPCSPKTVETKLHKVLNAWEDLSPTRPFGGMTFAEFRTQTKPSLDARAEVTRLENELTAATSQRDIADVETCRLLTRVINGVRGDVTHGEDSPLYEAMGYVRKSERKSGLKRPRKESVKIKAA